MHISSSPVALSGAPWSSLDVDWLFVPLAEGEPALVVNEFDAVAGGHLSAALSSGEFKAKAYDTFITPVVSGGCRARRIVLVGGGRRDDFGAERVRRLATVSALVAREHGVRRFAFACRTPSNDRTAAASNAPFAQAAADGLVFGMFDGARYKTVDHEAWQPEQIVVSMSDTGAAREADGAVHRGVVFAQCVNAARELANEPGNRLRPVDFADRAAALATAAQLTVEILDERRIEALGMRLLLGVGRGSEQRPRLLVVKYTPRQTAAGGKVLGLVGKGVTFDSGGLSIKPSQGMERMKDDMAGGAAVVAALCAIARLEAPVPVLGIVPIAENMPSGHAIRPGDVIESASGKTVEVTDTDAEGRLILADALWYARQQGATHLVDVATLTGACVVALGHTTSGLFAKPAAWNETLLSVARSAGERVWPMPLFEDYRDQLRSDIADLKNVGGRPAGAITAAVFLKEFAGEGPWAHLDVAGTSWNEEEKPYLPKGATGVSVRTLTELAFTEF